MSIIPIILKKKKLGSGLNQIDPDYNAVLSAFTTPPSTEDKVIQETFITDLKTLGVFEKAEILDLVAIHDTSLINWASPGTFDPSAVGAVSFEQYGGYRGGTGKYIRTNFIPATDGTKISQNNICVMAGIADDMRSDIDCFGGYGASNAGRTSFRLLNTSPDDNAYVRCNGAAYSSLANTNAIKHYTASRNSGTSIDIYLNKTKTAKLNNSDGLCPVELYFCGANGNGTLQVQEVQVRYYFVFSYLTEAEVNGVIDAIEKYLANYKKNVIDYDNHIATSDKSTKSTVTLTTYDGSGTTAHPSVINIGSEWHGYQYWMANTPYPSQNPDYENPSIWASTDGDTWVIPDGLTNPIVAKPEGVGNYNADTDIFYDSVTDKLYVFWKKRTATLWSIQVISSADGVTWGDEKTAMTFDADETECVSPSIVKIGSTYYMYYYAYQTTIANNKRFRRSSCSTIDGTYENKQTLTLPIPSDWILWHSSVDDIGGVYYMTTMQQNTACRRIYLLKSTDGVTFEIKSYPILWEYQGTYVYRPCLVMIGTQLTMFYTSISGAWTCKRMNIDLV